MPGSQVALDLLEAVGGFLLAVAAVVLLALRWSTSEPEQPGPPTGRHRAPDLPAAPSSSTDPTAS